MASPRRNLAEPRHRLTKIQAVKQFYDVLLPDPDPASMQVATDLCEEYGLKLADLGHAMALQGLSNREGDTAGWAEDFPSAGEFVISKTRDNTDVNFMAVSWMVWGGSPGRKKMRKEKSPYAAEHLWSIEVMVDFAGETWSETARGASISADAGYARVSSPGSSRLAVEPLPEMGGSSLIIAERRAVELAWWVATEMKRWVARGLFRDNNALEFVLHLHKSAIARPPRSIVNPHPPGGTGAAPPPDTLPVAEVRRIIAERRAQGIPGPDWDVFAVDRDPGFELQVDDDANLAADEDGLPILTDEDITQLPEAQAALREVLERSDVESSSESDDWRWRGRSRTGTVPREFDVSRGPNKNPPRPFRPQRVVAQLQKDTRPAFQNGALIGSADDVAIAMSDYIGARATEAFVVLFINIRNRIVGYTEMSSNSTSSVTVDGAGIFREALAAGAAAIITIHNHPSGDPDPSEEDRELWKRLAAIGKLMGVPVLDDMVIGERQYFSRLAGLSDLPAAAKEGGR